MKAVLVSDTIILLLALIMAVASSLMLPVACGRFLRLGGIESEPSAVPVLVAQQYKVAIVDHAEKIPSGEVPSEFVEIASQRYQVTLPWAGHRLTARVSEVQPLLVSLPRSVIDGDGSIYVTKATHRAFLEMSVMAVADGVPLLVDSGYRSVAYQKKIFEQRMVAAGDFQSISRWVAPPGYSEHMLGTAIDLSPSNWTFGGTKVEQWMEKNAFRFGFNQSYPRHSPHGFTWEPWHWRFVGDS
ncbi:MAG: M15 family metallopeptidase [Proteobacteria bacterium]|nr:M15 family metallopeptidase [Pseudomonadota bacterium]MBU1688956.1 M15 family metallopeptidase [Pseudomonadota bacterium]